MRWQKIIVSGAILILLLALAGCTLLAEKNKEYDYKSAGKSPPLDIPPDLISPAGDERYAIPGGTESSGTTYSEFTQEVGSQPRAVSSSTILPSSGPAARIERAGTERWLVVSQPPEAVWPIVKEFWQEMGFLIKIEVPEAGIMETDWAEKRARVPEDFIRNFLSTFLDSLYSTAERDKYRTRLERGEEGSTEIYISHRGMDEVVEGGSTQRTIWQPRPADPDMEAEMLTRLMIRFGISEEQSKRELATIDTSTKTRAYIDPENRNTLILNEAFDRSWRRVGLALDRIGFTVEDRNRLDGVYFVRYIDPDSDTHKSGTDDGILSGLAFWRSDTDKEPEKYIVRVSETGVNSSHVMVYDENNALVNLRTASRILDLLHEQLK